MSYESIPTSEQDESSQTLLASPRVEVSVVRHMLSAISICEVILILAKLGNFGFLVVSQCGLWGFSLNPNETWPQGFKS